MQITTRINDFHYLNGDEHGSMVRKLSYFIFLMCDDGQLRSVLVYITSYVPFMDTSVHEDSHSELGGQSEGFERIRRSKL